RPDWATCSHQGHAEVRMNALAPRECAVHRKFVYLGLEISNVDSPALEHRTAIDRPAGQRGGRLDWRWPVVCDEEEPVAVHPEYRGVKCPAKSGGALGHGIEHRLEVGRRARADGDDFSSGGLLLTCFGELLDHSGIFGSRDGWVCAHQNVS